MKLFRRIIVLSLAGLAACAVRSSERNGAESPSRTGDACAALNERIAALPDGATLSLDAGPYVCHRGLAIEGKRRITLQGPSADRPAVFRFARVGPLKNVGQGANAKSYSERRHITVTNSEGITLRNIRVEGPNKRVWWHCADHSKPECGPYAWAGTYGWHVPGRTILHDRSKKISYEFESGFSIHESTRVNMEHCSVHQVYGDGLTIWGNRKESRDVQVRDFEVSFNGRQGVAVTWARNVLLERVVIHNSRRSGFDLEPGNAAGRRVDFVEIGHSRIVKSIGLPFASKGAHEVNDIYIHDNTMGGLAVPWLEVEPPPEVRRRNWRIENNVRTKVNGVNGPSAPNSPRAPIEIWNVDNVRVVGNTSPLPLAYGQSRTGVDLRNCGGTIEIRNNQFERACCVYESINTLPTATVTASNNTFAAEAECAEWTAPRDCKR